MEINLEKLLNSLDELVTNLSKGGKNEQAKYFSNKIKQIKSSSEDPHNVDLILQELIACRAMAQYGNFSHIEEKYLDEVIDDAIACSAFNLNEMITAGAQLRKREIKDSTVKNQICPNLTFWQSVIKNCSFKDTDLSGIGFFEKCIVEDSVFEKVSFNSAALVSVAFRNCHFVNCDFRSVYFDTSVFENVIFEKCKIIDTEINPKNLKNVTYIGKLTDARFISRTPDTKLLVDFSNCKLDFVSFENCDLTHVKPPIDKNCIFIKDLKSKSVKALRELQSWPETSIKKVIVRRINYYSKQNEYIFNVNNFIEIEGKEVAKQFFKLLGYECV
ncbi:hypothetical protein XA3_01070 [Xylocopilactobacillus apicola]|uniref:Pentapeptide repeat-containing protein n=2 Tax=Xylocopilactobacillus apicola TaxID=2932184 RepID=A0AAU9CZ17_9LACO|nr:hypothetical protein XA3_01070 [Xylocopilactobacillus apicola]